MTFDTWASSRHRLVPVLVLFFSSCALPRAGTNAESGVVVPADGGDSSVRDSGTICAPPGCNDGNICTDDLCAAAGCEHVPNNQGCDDGVFCNGFDSCADGACQPGSGDPCAAPTICNESRHACQGCNVDSDCPADNTPEWTVCDFGGSPCALNGTRTRTVTTYACDLATHECQETMTPEMGPCTRAASDTNGTSCSVGPAAGLCQGGACCAGCLEGSSCAPGTSDSQCGAAGASCVSCGGGATHCVAGACVECRAQGDCNDGNPCTNDACTGGSCTHSNNTASCNDANACTTGDVCAGGSCSGTAMACGDGNAYTIDACSGGACTHTCTTCTSGAICVVGTATAACGMGGGACANCNDGNPCTADGCSGARACTNVNLADGTACPTGVCLSGVCGGCTGNRDCLDPAAPQCDTGTGSCGPCGGAGPCGHFTSPTLPFCLLPAGECIASCGSGCKHRSLNICYAGTANAFCGSGGAVCADCTALGQTCNGGSCM